MDRLLPFRFSQWKSASWSPVLWYGGLSVRRYPQFADAVNYAPRVTIPALMLNGKYDYLLPTQTSQQPLYDLLGAPKEDKRYVTYEAGHADSPRGQVIRETLNWLDRYLGPIN